MPAEELTCNELFINAFVFLILRLVLLNSMQKMRCKGTQNAYITKKFNLVDSEHTQNWSRGG